VPDIDARLFAQDKIVEVPKEIVTEVIKHVEIPGSAFLPCV